jgi:hypothetical protein
MVVMIVRKDDRIDRRQGVEVDRRRNATTRAGKRKGRRAPTPDRVEKEIQSAYLEKKAGMTDPGDG